MNSCGAAPQQDKHILGFPFGKTQYVIDFHESNFPEGNLTHEQVTAPKGQDVAVKRHSGAIPPSRHMYRVIPKGKLDTLAGPYESNFPQGNLIRM